jgi:signal transduction histidine kinase
MPVVGGAARVFAVGEVHDRQAVEADETIELSEYAIEVIDNGPGIDAAMRQDIFLPFFSTKKEGTGVGLSLARQIALAHDGTLTCAPATSGGSCFRLLL